MKALPPAAGIIATANRPEPLAATLQSLAAQNVQLQRLVVIDGSTDADDRTRNVTLAFHKTVTYPVQYERARQRGAAIQRNQGAELASEEILFFFDDDILLEQTYVEQVLQEFAADPEQKIGGVMGTIVNQTYGTPSSLSRYFFRIMAGRSMPSYAGKVIGPAINLLPEDVPDTVQEVEWLPSTAVAYRASVFREHRFGSFFTGYSFCEDLHLSARVAKTHRLLNTTKARLFHKDLGGSTHTDWFAIGRMQVINRWIVLTDVLERRSLDLIIKFFAASLASSLIELRKARAWHSLRSTSVRSAGRLAGCFAIVRGAHPLASRVSTASCPAHEPRTANSSNSAVDGP